MAIDVTKIQWATNDETDPTTGGPNKIEPTPEYKLSGLKKDQPLAREFTNYQWAKAAEFFADLQSQIDALTVSASTGILTTIFHVGSWYYSDDPTSPADRFGFGTWERVKGKFVVGLDEADTTWDGVNETGGAKTHSHTTVAAGSHNHTGSTGYAGTHSHGGSTALHALTVFELPSENPITLRSTTVQTSDADPGATWPVSGGQTSSLTNTAINVNWSGAGQGHSHGISSDGNHAHSISTDGSHTHTVNSSSNLPPFIATHIWHRTA